MNHIYRSIWNASTRTVTAVSEHAKRGGKKTSSGKNAVVSSGFILRSASIAVALSCGSVADAAPTGGTVVAGNASISSASGNTTIQQTTQHAALTWQSFDIGVSESVRFVQPNSTSVALNRVLGSDPSSILGSLSSNGKVFLVNPNGILFGTGAQVSVSGLVASTRDIADSDFMAGRYEFNGSSNGNIVNQGSIHADGGYVALLGANVSNQGVIAAKMGSVALASGNALTLDVAGDGLLNVSVNSGAVDALVHNGGLIQADGGQVLLTARSASTLLQSAVNNTGVIQAQTIENRNGTIRLLGDMDSGTVEVAGTLDASAPDGGDGGFIDTSAALVKIADDTTVTTAAARGLTGSWLIDPTDYNIAASGGNITGAALSSNLVSTNVTILSSAGSTGTAGNVNVNDTVTWSANRLTLNAQNSININTAMHASGTASLALEYGQGAVAAGNTSAVNVNAPVNLPAGNNFSTRLGSDGATISYTVITSLGAPGSTTGTDLQGIDGAATANYALGSDIDASSTSTWNSAAGFMPLGTVSELTGIFDGLGHAVSGLVIDRPAMSNVGLFGRASNATFRNVGVINSSITGNNYVGLLAANSFVGTYANVYSTGTVTGTSWVGGLVGLGNGVTMTNAYSSANVTGTSSLVGGLLGQARFFGTITNSYATGAVNGSTAYYVGGLVGQARFVSVTNSYATGAVSGEDGVGGLVGFLDGTTIASSYSSGVVSGNYGVGGLVGDSNGTVSSSYWNVTTSGQGSSAGGAGLTSSQMLTAANFSGFNFTTTAGAAGNNWVMVNVNGTLNNVGGATGATRPMLASEYSTTINNAHQLQLMSMDPTASYTLGKNINAVATGTANDVWSGSTFIPVRNGNVLFTGTFDGLDHTISNLTIYLPAGSEIGLFGAVGSGGIVRNVGLVGGSVAGNGRVGGLVGINLGGSISGSYVTGAVNGSSYVGGLVGFNRDGGVVSTSHASGAVTATSYVGGLVGMNHSGSTVSDSHATGAVTGSGAGGLVGYNMHTVANSYAMGTVQGNSNVGGLVGMSAWGSTVSRSYATGAVTASNTNAGGLIGSLSGGAVSTSYATGAVQANHSIGGLVGYSDYGMISNSYATGAVTGGNRAGGLVGYSYGSTMSNSYAIGAVSGTGDAGGLIGYQDPWGGTISNSFWDITTSGQASSAGGIGMTTADMQTLANFTGATAANGNVNPAWDMTSTWVQYDTHSYPLLRAFMTTLTVTANDAVKTYDGNIYSGGNGATYSVAPDAGLLGTLHYSGNAQGAINAGSYAITAGGLYSTSQQGYVINYVDGALTVNAADLAVSTSAVTKSYDGGLGAAGMATVAAGTLFGDDTLGGGTFAFTDKNAGNGNTRVTTTGVIVADGNNGANYNITYVDNTSSTITPATLSATVTAADKIYDGNTDASATLSSLVGLIGSETLDASATASFNSKDVAAANLVTINSVALSDGTNGGLASNYTLASGQTAVAHITPRELTVVGQVASDKIYDGTTAAMLHGGSLAGVVAGETVGLNEAGTFVTADRGNGIAVTATDSLSGAAAANYILTQPVGLAANITAAVQPEVPPVVAAPPVIVSPPADATPPVTASPPSVDATPAQVAVTSTVAYTSAVGHVVSSSPTAPRQISVPAPLVAPAIASPSAGPIMTYDLTGLNLTVIAPDAGMPVVQPQSISDEDGKK